MPRSATALRPQPELSVIERPQPVVELDVIRQAELTEAELRMRIAGIAPDDDLVEYTRRCLQAMAPDIDPAVPRMLERQIRDTYGREKVYIAMRSGEGRAPRNEQIRREFAAGERVPALARRWSLSEAQIWNIVRSTGR